MGWFSKDQEDKQIDILQWKLKMARDKKSTAEDKKHLERLEKAAKPKKGFWDF